MQTKKAFRIPLEIFGLLLFIGVVAEPSGAVTISEVEELLSTGKPEKAANTVDNAPNRDAFLSSPKGKAYYSASICYARKGFLTEPRINEATSLISQALAAEPPFTDAFQDWATKVSAQCALCKPQLQRVTRITTTRDTWGGKIAQNCEIEWPSDVTGTNDHALSPLPMVPTLPGGDQNIESALETVLAEHATPDVNVKVCAPFIVASSSDSVADICESSALYLEHFERTYGKPSIGAWIVIHHYGNGREVAEHARLYGGPPCKGILGYYDPISQRIAYRAPDGSYGTLLHELTHAFIYWDAPGLPRWLEEGMAALHEHTNKQYTGLQNPWRQRYLSTPEEDRAYFCDRVLRMKAAEFERRPRPACVSRYAMRRIQAEGSLPALYRRASQDPDLQTLDFEHPSLATAETLRQTLPGVIEFCAVPD